MTPSERYDRQLARQAWAEIRVAAIELREARQAWERVKATAPERVLHVRQRDLEMAESRWQELWFGLNVLRERREAQQ